MRTLLLLSMAALPSLFFLSGCTGGSTRAPFNYDAVPGAAITVNQITAGTFKAEEDSEILSLKVHPGAAITTKTTDVALARQSSLFVITSGNTSKAGYDITYQERLQYPKVLPLELVFVNDSSRAFRLPEMALRVQCTNKTAKATVAPSYKWGSLLAPGESAVVPVHMTAFQYLTADDTLSIAIYEMPKSIAENGELTSKTNATVTVHFNVEPKEFLVKRYLVNEQREWPAHHAVPKDLAGKIHP